MRKLIAFETISLDGYFADRHGDMQWAHKGNDDPEFATFVRDNAKGSGMLLFGRVTYEMMAAYWPTPRALQGNPVVAERMNAGPKIVFSRTLDTATWSNTTLLRNDPAAEVHLLKSQPGPDMAILGSGSVVAQLAQARLIDEFQIVVSPIILGGGKSLFDGIHPLGLTLVQSRRFANGKMFLTYAPSGHDLPRLD
jgi:dihydrofolate reductase